MLQQIEMAKAAREHLASNHPWLAVHELERLAMELSQTSYERQPATERQRLAEELRGLQLLVEQGAVLYGKRLEKVVPNGSAYSCYGRPSAISSGGCSNLGPDLMA